MMRWTLGAVLLLTAMSADASSRRPILYDPVALNIGVGCQWQAECIVRQRTAMASALTYVARKKPPQALVHLCNRNASRGGGRVDWVGYDHCIRNPKLKRRVR
ncbi:hypothetical protein [Sphingomonas flavescens]|uniref:hypothetical protein n=1 Tax=Sphingomonas flavescens TaxID=3132797 RepID=UPI0028043B14|nr:hypothetical protein [Sphingomonas limnosediminicola]